MLTAPAGQATRPTAERLRQALFDLLWHAPWGGRGLIEGATVVDGFAGTGALGLEALSRGAGRVVFFEQDAAALAALRANIAGLGAAALCQVTPGDVCQPPPGAPARLVFLDPPYQQKLVARAAAGLRAAGWIGPDTLVVAELAAAEAVPDCFTALRAERRHGAGRIVIGHVGPPSASLSIDRGPAPAPG